jgi:tetratricopeptide (TPR) repeat protein
MAFRIWSALLVGGLASLWILPLVQTYTGLNWTLLATFLILLIVFMSFGWVFNWYGANLVKRFITEATIWQRAARHHEAEEAYRRAIAVFDSFVLSPGTKKKRAANLVAHLARYYLARADKNSGSEAFIISYLKIRPEDNEVAEYWLDQVKNQVSLPKEYQDLVFRIGRAQPENRTIQHTIARLYLRAGRTDFPALQTYRRVLQEDTNGVAQLAGDLSAIFLKEGRADEWALQMYLHAFPNTQDRSLLLKGIAACVHWIAETGDNKALLDRAKKIIGGIDPERLKKMRTGFNPPIIQPSEEKVKLKNKVGAAWYPRIGWQESRLYQFFRSIPNFLSRQIMTLFQNIRHSQRAKRLLKWIMLTAMTVGMIWLMVNTVGHLLRTKVSIGKDKIAEVVTDPFTLQVAAYLKPEHAEKYVAFLRKHKLDAYWTEAKGKKRKWYQVRVSHFASKESAIAYGESLKKKGLIDDFYVANYSRP